MQWHEKINTTLATSISLVNAIIAIALPSMGFLVGLVAGGGFFGKLLMAIAGVIAGTLASFAACGITAVLIDIRRGLGMGSETPSFGRPSAPASPPGISAGE